MKIAIVIDNETAVGGGFNKALNAALQMERLAPDNVALVVTGDPAAEDVLRARLRTEVVRHRFGMRDRAMGALARADLTGAAQARIRMVGPFEKMLIRRGIDLVYFAAPSTGAMALQKLNMISTVWDSRHRDAPEFPEAREFGAFCARERLLSATLPKSLAVIADCETSAARLTARYGLDPDRVIAMPFAAMPEIAPSADDADADAEDAAAADGPPADGYLFCPAQFWPHANHTRLLEALALLNHRGQRLNAVFCGADRGRLATVKADAAARGLLGQISFPGFTPPEEIAALYAGAAVVATPTYFGPTCLPPLEAWEMRRPLVASSAIAGQVGDAGLIFDPDDAEALADAIAEALKSDVAARLIAAGEARLAQLAEARAASEKRLVAALERYGRRRACW